MSNPSDIVNAYFAGVTAGDAGAIAALFAPDAVLQNASGLLHGAEAIKKMYENGLASVQMKPRPKALIIDGDRVAVEIDLDAAGSQVKLGDFFTIRDGLIHELMIYSLTPNDGQLFDKVGVVPDN